MELIKEITDYMTEEGINQYKEIMRDYPLLFQYYDVHNGNFLMDEKFVDENMEIIKKWLKNHNEYFLFYNVTDEAFWVLTDWLE